MQENSKNLTSAYIALGLVCVLWGTTYLGIRVAIETMPPFWMAGTRQFTAGFIMILFCLVRRYEFPSWREVLFAAYLGVLTIAIGNGAVTWAEHYISSGLASLLCALTPFWMIGINWMKGGRQSISRLVIAGLMLGLAGLVLVFYDNLADFVNPKYTIGVFAILIANFTWSLGSVLTKHRKPGTNNPFVTAGLQMLAAGACLLIISFFTETPSATTPSMESVWAWVFLTIFGSLIAYGAYVYALQNLPTEQVSIYGYINPIVAVFLGWLVLDERLTVLTLVAFAITLAGVYLVNKGAKKQLANVRIKDV